MSAIIKPRNRLAQAVVQDDGSIKVPEDVLARAGVKPGDEVIFSTTGQRDLRVVALLNLTPDELFERFGDPTITEIDWPKLQAEIEEDIARDVIEEMRRNA